ncbi:MAG: tetratricopeptide repeat protein [Mariprofundaceae bacterium]|nr:tetratricopeptide repeat protein [Mariprofundaceae bacterium]
MILATVLILNACVPLKKHDIKPPNNKQPVAETMQDRSERSLYLTAQAAKRDGQQALAIQLLSILISQNTEGHVKDTAKPALELAELLLNNNRASEALPYLQPLIQQASVSNFPPKEQKNLHLMYARSLAASNQINHAQDSLLRLLNQYPKFMLARYLQIELFTHTNQLALAHMAIDIAIAIQDNPTLRQFQADVFSREGKLENARKSLEKMLQLNPKNDTAILLLSQFEIQQGHSDQAEKILRAFIQENPENLRVQHNLARLLIQLKHPEKAILVYENMSNALPGSSDIASALGLLYYQLGDFQNSSKQFKKALKTIPDNASYQFYLASSLEALHENKQAGDLYKKIQSEHQIWPEAQLRLASMGIVDKKYASSLKYINSVLKNNPDNAQAWILLSTVYLVQQKYRQLLSKTEGATILKTMPARLQMNRAIAFEHFKRYKDLEKVLEALLHNNPKHADALNFLAYTYAEQGIKLDEAKEYIQRALKLQPDDGYYLDSLAWIYYKLGDYDSAANIQWKAIKIVKNDPTMYEHLGDILWQQGEQDKAILQWKRALTLKPDQMRALRLKIKRGM